MRNGQLPRHIVSNGPYKLVSWEPNLSLIMERNPEYPGYFPGNLIQIILTLMTIFRMDYGLEQYRRNTFDTIFVSQMSKLREQDASEDLKILNAYHIVIILDLIQTHPLFRDRRIRQAIAHAIDKQPDY